MKRRIDGMNGWMDGKCIHDYKERWMNSFKCSSSPLTKLWILSSGGRRRKNAWSFFFTASTQGIEQNRDRYHQQPSTQSSLLYETMSKQVTKHAGDLNGWRGLDAFPQHSKRKYLVETRFSGQKWLKLPLLTVNVTEPAETEKAQAERLDTCGCAQHLYKGYLAMRLALISARWNTEARCDSIFTFMSSHYDHEATLWIPTSSACSWITNTPVHALTHFSHLRPLRHRRHLQDTRHHAHKQIETIQWRKIIYTE